MEFRIQSAAKINLTLDILRQRADGYHELASVVHTVGIWDELEVEFNENGAISFGCNRPELVGDDNLCVRAIQKWNKATGENVGARIHLEKRIPTGAGLGGGSGNAAAMLLALNRAAKIPLSAEDLSAIGAKLGADVPLFLAGGAGLMEGIGDKITPLVPLKGWVLIVKPEESYATPAIYRGWDEAGFQSDNKTPALLEIWRENEVGAIAARIGNDLERAAAKISDLPARIVAVLQNSGASGTQMSGSGSACFGIFSTEADALTALKKSKLELAKLVPLSDVRFFVAPFCERGVEIAQH
jgi:4-diphosphocytidyl-2-C-methyl-D-erythritol kinase